jgi:hypothetical protein
VDTRTQYPFHEKRKWCCLLLLVAESSIVHTEAICLEKIKYTIANSSGRFLTTFHMFGLYLGGNMTYKRRTKYIPPEMFENWGGLFMPKKYEVKFKETWVSCYRGAVVGESLHYELYDGSEHVASPGEWRVKGEAETVKPSKPTMTNVIAGEEQRFPDARTRGVRSYTPDDDNILDI